MEEQSEESGFVVGDCREPVEECGTGLGLASEIEALVGEDDNTVEVLDLGVCDVSEIDGKANDGGLGTGDSDTDNSGSDEKQLENNVGSGEDMVDTKENGAVVVIVSSDDESVESETERNESSDDDDDSNVDEIENNENGNCEVEDSGGACDAEQNVETEKYEQSLVDGEMPEDEADQEKESDTESEEEYEENVGLDEQGNSGSESEDAELSESAQVPEDSIQLSEEELEEENQGTVSEVNSAAGICREEDIIDVDKEEENGEAMELDCAAVEQVGNDVTVGGVLENGGSDSRVLNEMEIDEQKDNAGMVTESADAATGEVERLDHNALFDPSSDITNFIDFSGVSSWSGNIQDLKTETGNVSVETTVNAGSLYKLKIKFKGVDNEPKEAHVAFRAESPAGATDCSKEAPDTILGSDENEEDEDLECLDEKTEDHQDAMREEDDITQETPSIDPDTEMEENPNNFDDGTDSEIKTNGVKRKADHLSEHSPGEGRKTVSFAKVSSFKIGACIARAASQMAGSPSVLKGSNVGDETLPVESFVSQLHCAATDPDKENVVSEIAAGFFLDFRNSSAKQQVTPENVNSKPGKPSTSNTGTEAFEFEENGDTYWTDRVIQNGGEEQTPTRVIQNGGEEQTPTTDKESYKVVPVELKPVQLQRTRRPYRRRQSLITNPRPASNKPADYDENAPAELIMNFSETDTIPPEKNLSKMFRHFGPIRESQTEVDKEKNRARVVYKKGSDAEVAYNSAGRFSIFGTKAVKYELSYTVTEAFKVHPCVVAVGEES